jgi:hypothetical protein
MNIHPVGAKFFHVDGRMDRQTDRQRYDESNSVYS